MSSDFTTWSISVFSDKNWAKSMILKELFMPASRRKNFFDPRANSTCMNLHPMKLVDFKLSPVFTSNIWHKGSTYLNSSIKAGVNEVFRVDVDVEGFDGGFSRVGSQPFPGVSFENIDESISIATEEEITVVVEPDDIDVSFVHFELHGIHCC